MKISDLLKKRDALKAEHATLEQAAETRALNEQESGRLTEILAEAEQLNVRVRTQAALDEADRQAPGTRISPEGDEFERESRNFSLLRAIALTAGMKVDGGREQEVSDEIAHRTGRTPTGIFAPSDILRIRPASHGLETRVTTAAGGGAGAIFEQARPDMWIDALRANLITGQLGATVLSDLEGGPVSIPATDTGQAGQWIADDQALVAADVDINKRQLTPKTVGALTEFSRNFVVQSSRTVEEFARRDFGAALAVALDGAALVGGGANEPSGILDNITPLSASTPSWAEILSIIEAVEVANAAMGRLGWAANPRAVKTLRSTTKVTSDAGAGFIMDQPNALAGYSAFSTTNLPVGSPAAGTAIFGDWTSLVIGYWTGIDVLANPYGATAFAKGNIQVRALVTADVILRHVASFAGATDIP